MVREPAVENRLHGLVGVRAPWIEVLTPLLVTLALKAILDWIYVAYVLPNFGASFGGSFKGWPRLLETYLWAALLGSSLAISLRSRPRGSGIILSFQFACVVMPLLTLCAFGQAPPSFTRLVSMNFLFLTAMSHAIPRISIPHAGRSLRVVVALLLGAATLYVYGILFWSGGAAWFSFNLAKVYAVRARWTSLSWPLLGYFLSWQGNALNPALLAWGLYRRRSSVVLVALLMQVVLFGLTGQKAFPLAMGLVAGVYWVYRRRTPLAWMLLAAGALIVFSYLVYALTGDQMAPSVLVRRLFFVPAHNHALYYDFFSQPTHPHVLLSNSILARLVEYPYDMPVTRLISWAYWGRDFSPNVGYLGDAYAHFGGFGTFLFSFILAIALRILDSLERPDRRHLVAAVVAAPAAALVNSALFTTLLTHGLLVSMLLVWILPQGHRAKKPREGTTKAVA